MPPQFEKIVCPFRLLFSDFLSGFGTSISISILVLFVLQEERRMPEWKVEQRIYVHRSL